MPKKIFLSGIFLLILLLGIESSLLAQENNDEIIKVDVALVNIPVIVSDRFGRNVLDLKIDDFSLFEDGKPQKIEYLSNLDSPLNIVILLDTSRSTQLIFEKIKNAAKEFIKQLKSNDRCMVISFDQQVRVEREFTSNTNSLDRAIKNTLMSEKFGTLLQDAVFVTVDKELAKVKGRKAIILISDGKDAGSSISKKDLLYRLEESDTPIYSIIYEVEKFTSDAKIEPVKANKTQIVQQRKNLETAEFLQKMSNITAGRIYPKEINNLGEAFKTISDELRKQYLIGYYPDDSNYSIDRHQIKVKVNKSDIVVRTKNTNRLRVK
ncbi:MAG: VWA domain-containing protein [Acidobacteriota bacterium]